jgi:protein gp37
MIFVCAHGDLFHPEVPDAWIDKVFAVMALCPRHTFQVLTKRPERMREYVTELMAGGRQVLQAATAIRGSLVGALVAADSFGMLSAEDIVSKAAPEPAAAPTRPLPNVWLGTSVEDQRRADERIPHLLDTPAVVRFLSAEPLLGPIDLSSIPLRPGSGAKKPVADFTVPMWDAYRNGIGALLPTANALGGAIEAKVGLADLDWIIVGGESGPGARPMHPDWARSLRDRCAAAGVAFFFKQWGNWLGGRYFLDLDDHLQFENLEEQVLTLRRSDRQHCWDDDASPEGIGSLHMTKKAAGRLLDSVEHNAMPGRANV